MPKLEMTDQLLSEARKRGKLIDRKEELIYSGFREGFRGIPRGTIVINERIIFGFPHIKRIFTLKKGLERNITASYFYIEEKIDGYNLRIAKINGNVYAFSRGGFLDYFASEKARELITPKFFSDFPDYVLCAEMVGNTPYTRPTKGFDVKIFVFDVDTGNGNYISPEERQSLLKKYKIEEAPSFGKFAISDLKKIREIALSIMKQRKEGIIFKSEDRKEAVKYVNPFADIEDIAGSSHSLFDMPLGFYVQRVLRSAIFIREFELNKEKFAKELGIAFYEKLTKAITEVENDKQIYDDYEIIIKDLKIWDWIHRHMSKEIKIDEVSRTKAENGKTKIKFRKIYKKSTHKIKEALSGKGIED
ncbi:MAG: RNA ligase [Candidatus Micrarchaeota archaeon]